MSNLAGIAVDQAIQLSRARGEAEAWRLLAEQALELLHSQHVELERIRERYHELLDERRRERDRPKAAA